MSIAKQQQKLRVNGDVEQRI
jgi:hypothetical protein